MMMLNFFFFYFCTPSKSIRYYHKVLRHMAGFAALVGTTHTASEMIFTCKLNQNIKRLLRTKMAPIVVIVLYATKY